MPQQLQLKVVRSKRSLPEDKAYLGFDSCDFMSTFTFGKEKRVVRRSEYLAIQAEGQKWHSKHFVACFRKKGETDKTSRLGVTITKKVDKRAVKRNLLRRKIREIFRLNYPNFSQTFDVVLIAKRGAVMLDNESIKNELFYLFRKIGLAHG